MKSISPKGNWNEIKGKFRYSYEELSENEMIFAQDEFLDGKKRSKGNRKKNLEK